MHANGASVDVSGGTDISDCIRSISEVCIVCGSESILRFGCDVHSQGYVHV